MPGEMEPYNQSSIASSRQSSSSQSSVTHRNHPDVPSSVRSLLLSTKRLQELLKQWSAGQASETHVSDVFVEVGTNFNNTVRAFAFYQIDLSDIHTIPQELRQVLEQCLGEDPSPGVLDSYMPDLKRVLSKLLKGLLAREDAWKATVARERGSYEAR